MSDEIDTQFTNGIVCPYCGHSHETDGDFTTGDNEYSCSECERDFVFEPEFSVSFCSCTMEEHLQEQIRRAESSRKFYEENNFPDSAATYAAQVENYRKRLDALKAGA